MSRLRTLLVFFFILKSGMSFSAQTNVILRLTRIDQQDTIGYNIVEELPKLLYNEIQNNRLKLWDSPKKNIEIKASTLKEIERSSGLSFSNIDNIFVYEFWTEQKTQISGQLVGINFSTRNKKDEDVTFGFVEYQDIKTFLQNNFLHSNINGTLRMSFDQALQLNRFNYSFVQYGNQTFSNYALSEKVKNDLFNGKKWFYEGPAIVQDKKVSYTIERDNVYGLLLMDTLERYFNQNIEEFFNLGGDKILSYINHKKARLSKVDVTELWTKTAGGIDYVPLQLVIYCDAPLSPVKMSDALNWKLIVAGLKLDDFLKKKSFNFDIININNVDIDKKDSEAYLEALKKGNWNILSEIVKKKI